MNKHVILLIMAFSMYVATLVAQTTPHAGQGQPMAALSGTVYKVKPDRLTRYQDNALTVMRNFYATLPECGDLDVKENFIANVMIPETVLKVDFYTRKNNPEEYLSADRYILEFMKEYGTTINSGDGLDVELTNITFANNLVHPEGDEHAVLLQLRYVLTIRHQGKVVKRGYSDAICYFPSRTDYRTCKVMQVMPVKVPSTTGKEQKRLTGGTQVIASKKQATTGKEVLDANTIQPTRPVVVHGMDYDTHSSTFRTTHQVKRGETLNLICKKYGITLDELYAVNPKLKNSSRLKLGTTLNIPYSDGDDRSSGKADLEEIYKKDVSTAPILTTPHPDLHIRIHSYIHSNKEFAIVLMVENRSNRNVRLRPYANIYSSFFKCQAIDNEGNVYDDIHPYLGSGVDNILLKPNTPIKVRIFIPNVSKTATSLRLLEWRVYSDELGITLNEPIELKNVPLK